MIHPALNKTEVAERYYKKLGKFTNRKQAQRNFLLLKHPKSEVVREVLTEIISEQVDLMEGKQRENN